MARTADQLAVIVADALKDSKRGQTGAGGRVIKSAKVIAGATKASAETGVIANDNALRWTAKTAGTGGNAITVEFVVAGNNTPLTIGVVSNAITVNVATDGGGLATSTADQVKDAVIASGPASALVDIADAGASNGSGVVVDEGPENLVGGTAAGGDTIELKIQDEDTVVTKTLTIS